MRLASRKSRAFLNAYPRWQESFSSDSASDASLFGILQADLEHPAVVICTVVYFCYFLPFILISTVLFYFGFVAFYSDFYVIQAALSVLLQKGKAS